MTFFSLLNVVEYKVELHGNTSTSKLYLSTVLEYIYFPPLSSGDDKR